ncbi:hypothetical protein AKO1_006806 [Acrasis kona]|uniref:FAM192A/Fyv6 N-terminal domain-containing protein n=1 Tax=Acrasis kona TaxID=1008807 RepID=A0AAW2YNY0_9EUKA
MNIQDKPTDSYLGKTNFTNRDNHGFVRSTGMKPAVHTNNGEVARRPLWEQLKESRELKEQEDEERFRNLAPRGLDQDDIQFLNEHKDRQLKKDRDVRDHDEQAAMQFSRDVATSVITIEDKNRELELMKNANNQISDKKPTTIKTAELDLERSKVVIITKKNKGDKTSKKKKRTSDDDGSNNKKQKVDHPPVSSLLIANYGSSDEDDKKE